MVLKEVSVYAYKINIPEDVKRELINNFKIESSRSNVIEINNEENESFVLIVDNVDNNVVKGRLIKLRTVNPRVIDLGRNEIRGIPLDPNEHIIETSHFVLYLNDNLLLGEYNYYGIRSFSHFAYYLKKKFDRSDVVVSSIFDRDTFTKLSRSRFIRRLTVKVAPARVDFLEREFGLDVSRTLRLLREEGQGIFFNIDLSVSKDNPIRFQRFRNLFDRFRNIEKEGILKFNVYDLDNIKFDLLRDNRYHFLIDVELLPDERTVENISFYSRVIQHYQRARTDLLEYVGWL